MTRVLTVLPLLFTLACNQEDYYEKEFLENPFQTETPGGSTGGDQDGSTSGGDNGDTGGSSGDGSTGGSDGGGTSGGEEIPGTAHTETFEQKEINTKQVDILWVIDDSGSMRDEQAALGTNFDAFINKFIDKGVDFKMAITTTDVSSDSKRGAMVTNSDRLTSAFAQSNEQGFLDSFKSLVQVGIRGSGYEKGIEASYWFMEKHGANFLREDAYLAVVYLSDEEDQSSNTVKYYMDHLKSLKSDAGLVKAYSIVNKDLTPTSGMTVGYKRYEEASTLTAGKLADISGDFHTILADMGGDLSSLLDSFALAHTPIDGTLNVYINNVLVSNYTYDAGSRAIKFDTNDLPPVGASIKVEYKY